jgi:hypothetical protein
MNTPYRKPGDGIPMPTLKFAYMTCTATTNDIMIVLNELYQNGWELVTQYYRESPGDYRFWLMREIQ